jgi:hypothetical protein
VPNSTRHVLLLREEHHVRAVNGAFDLTKGKLQVSFRR